MADDHHCIELADNDFHIPDDLWNSSPVNPIGDLDFPADLWDNIPSFDVRQLHEDFLHQCVEPPEIFWDNESTSSTDTDMPDLIAIPADDKNDSDMPDLIEENEPPVKRRRLHGKQSVQIPPQVEESKSSRRARLCGIEPSTVRKLMRAGWPIAMFNLLAVIVSMVAPISRDVQCVEYFSGVGQIAKAFREAGHNSRTFDIIDCGDLQNLNTPAGLATALAYALSLAERGLAHWATVCSTWIFLSRGSTGRRSGRVWGLPGRAYISENVAVANAAATRMIMICLLLTFRKVCFILEQPLSSIMHELPLWSCIPRQLSKKHTHMGSFGAFTPKPTWLLSGHTWHRGLCRPLPADFVNLNSGTVTKCTSASGETKVAGGPRLKETQAYPPAYGVAVQQEWQQWANAEDDDDDDGSESSISDTGYENRQLDEALLHGDFMEACSEFGTSAFEWKC